MNNDIKITHDIKYLQQELVKSVDTVRSAIISWRLRQLAYLY